MKKLKRITGGLLVLFEGLDGVGKTTQLELSRQELIAGGWAVETTRNLGGTPIGEALRAVALSDTERSATTDLYISAAIQSALAESLQALRAAGNIILMDRGPLSFAAYHIFGNHAPEVLGWQFIKEGMASFRPELVLLYSTDIQTALTRARKHAAKADYYESKPLDYFERVTKGYAAAAKRYPVVTINAGQDIASVQTETIKCIQKTIAAKTSGV